MAKRKKFDVSAEADMTPMIDMTFQLIAFFMVLLNFGEAEHTEEIKLPKSVLAKPPDAPLVSPLVLNLTDQGTVLFNGEYLPIKALRQPLAIEKALLQANNKSPADATVVIRAHRDTRAGAVQELIQECQNNSFERFALRVLQSQETEP